MATITTSLQTNQAIYMSDPFQFLFQSSPSASATEFTWFAGPASTNAVHINGTGFTYTGSGNSAELASGTITNISIDVGNDNGSATAGDLVITGTEVLIAGNIKKGNARLFWNEILKGDDTFQLDGLEEAKVGLASNLAFGDDFSCANFAANHSDIGGNDLILGADNKFELIGDVYEVKGGQTERGGLIDISAQYTGGNDEIVSAFTDREVQLIGDANAVYEKGIVIGGDDELDNSRTASESSDATGDVRFIFSFGSVTGGNDRVITGSNGLGAGDAFVMSGNNGLLLGGDDVISGATLSCAGDLRVISSGTTGNTVVGGDDRIIGSNSITGDVVAGDVFLRESQSSTITGGNDVISGRGGDDQLFGEVANGDEGSVTGGNDRLHGGAGSDLLSGQSGNDRLFGGAAIDRLRGGNGRDLLSGDAGRDLLEGGAGADTFRFDPGSGKDEILDFADNGKKSDDAIDVTGYNFASVASIGRSVSGDNLVLDLGGGNVISVVDYLAGHASSDINDDILI